MGLGDAPPTPAEFFSYFWIKSILDYVRALANVPPSFLEFFPIFGSKQNWTMLQK